MGKKSTVFAPHLDDEVFALGGTLIKEVMRGNPVRIVYMTDGRNSHKIDLGIEKDPTPEEVAKERMKEVIKATQALGIPKDQLTFLNFVDGNLSENIESARRKVRDILAFERPNEIYVPWVNDKHADHIATNKAVLAAVGDIDRFVIVNEYITWVRNHVSRSGTQDVPLDGFFQAKGFEPKNVADVLPQKNEAIDAYKSQITPLWPSQGGRVVLDADFLRPFRENTNEYFLRYPYNPSR